MGVSLQSIVLAVECSLIPELGVELVMDIDAMPANVLGNMPEVMRRRFTSVQGIDRTLSYRS